MKKRHHHWELCKFFLIIYSRGGQIATSVVTIMALENIIGKHLKHQSIFMLVKIKYFVLRTNIEDFRDLLSVAITGALVIHSVVWRKMKTLKLFDMSITTLFIDLQRHGF